MNAQGNREDIQLPRELILKSRHAESYLHQLAKESETKKEDLVLVKNAVSPQNYEQYLDYLADEK